MINSFKFSILFLALGHGINDFIAGYFLGSLAQTDIETAKIGFYLIIYNFIAFGGQYPVALYIRQVIDIKKTLLAAYGINIIAIILFPFISSLSIVFMGIASAIYHVAGGSICAEKNKATNIGLFAAPGVAGLIAGGYLAYLKTSMDLAVLIISIGFFMILIKLPLPKKGVQQFKIEGHGEFKLDRHDMMMILLLSVISLRSTVWNIFQLIHENEYDWLLAIAVSAAAGKIVGGWLSDRIGWRLYVFISLAMSAPLVTFFKKDMLFFCIGTGLLQSGIPATTSLLIHSMKNEKEKAIALSFGTAIILGGIITPVSPVFFSYYFLLFVLVFLFMFLWWIAEKKAQGKFVSR